MYRREVMSCLTLTHTHRMTPNQYAEQHIGPVCYACIPFKLARFMLTLIEHIILRAIFCCCAVHPSVCAHRTRLSEQEHLRCECIIFMFRDGIKLPSTTTMEDDTSSSRICYQCCYACVRWLQVLFNIHSIRAIRLNSNGMLRCIF